MASRNFARAILVLVSMLATAPLAAEEWAEFDDQATPVAYSNWQMGFDFVFTRPYFESNVAYTTTESNGSSTDVISDTEFDYDFEIAPRVWLEYQTSEGVGARVSFWQFDQGNTAPTTSPPANGFGDITHPVFGGVDISSSIPTDTFSARSGIDAFTIDLEVTHCGEICNWQLAASGGVRYASITQDYFAQLRNGAGTLLGQIDYRRNLDGFGPTLALQVRRPMYSGLTFISQARGSLLFDDSRSRLEAGEDLDLITPFYTTRTTDRHGVLPIGELQIGTEWSTDRFSIGEVVVRNTLEGQLWSGAGSATSESGDVGFLGLNVGVAVVR